MKLITEYGENLPSQNFKTRHFSRTVEVSLPDDIGKEGFLKESDKWQKTVELLVKEDIKRHTDELMKQD